MVYWLISSIPPSQWALISVDTETSNTDKGFPISAKPIYRLIDTKVSADTDNLSVVPYTKWWVNVLIRADVLNFDTRQIDLLLCLSSFSKKNIYTYIYIYFRFCQGFALLYFSLYLLVVWDVISSILLNSKGITRQLKNSKIKKTKQHHCKIDWIE